jgi:hypothetical protein
LILALSACGERGPTPGEIADAAAPHLEEFEEFDSWARRASLGDPAFRSERAFLEAAFSPIRGNNNVINAWIAREGLSARTVSLRNNAEAPLALRWLPYTSASLHDVKVALGSFAGAGGLVRDAVVVSRTAGIDDGSTVRVIVAYSREAAQPH